MTEGAHVEIVDPKGDGQYPLVPSKVFINGVDVGFVAKDGVSIHVGGVDSLTEVTIRLMPSRVTIRGADNGPKFKHWGELDPMKDQEHQ